MSSPSTPINVFSSTIEVISAQAEFGASTITLVDPIPTPAHLTYAQAEPVITTPPRTPTPEITHTPARPRLTIAPDSETEEGEIIDRVLQHNYPLSPQSSLNVMQGHPELDASTLRTIAIGLANTAIHISQSFFSAPSAELKVTNARKLRMGPSQRKSTNIPLQCMGPYL